MLANDQTSNESKRDTGTLGYFKSNSIGQKSFIVAGERVWEVMKIINAPHISGLPRYTIILYLLLELHGERL